jgi:23S rRNA (uridine2552-2'-O)-methyltransferase
MGRQYKRQDTFYQRAKAEGYRSRAAYKLAELDERFGLLRGGLKVLDLGAWPGGWMQIAAERVGTKGIVVGIDLAEIEQFAEPNIKALVGDVSDKLGEALSLGGGRYDLVLSDMAPKLSGIREVDEAGCVGCAELALWAAGEALCDGGNLVVKVFKGNATEEFSRAMRPRFRTINRLGLDATRKSSNEFYIVGQGFLGSSVLGRGSAG